jgi:hypothetical protein
MDKDEVINMLDQAHLDLMDAKLLMDDCRYFHLAGELVACSTIMSKIIRTTQREY